jgi:hypothetical protein
MGVLFDYGHEMTDVDLSAVGTVRMRIKASKDLVPGPCGQNDKWNRFETDIGLDIGNVVGSYFFSAD